MTTITDIAKQYAESKLENARTELVGIETGMFENLLEMQAVEVLKFAMPHIREAIAMDIEVNVLEGVWRDTTIQDILTTVRGES